MALKDFLALSDDKLEIKHSQRPYDPSKDRAALIKSLNGADTQYQNGSTKAPNRMWTAANTVVAFTPKFKGVPLNIGGKETHYIPGVRFSAAIKALVASVEAGELDKVLEGSEGKNEGSAKPRAPRGQGLGKPERDNPEWMAKFREKYGEPDASIKNPVPNSKGTAWVSKAAYDRGQAAAASRAAGKKA